MKNKVIRIIFAVVITTVLSISATVAVSASSPISIFVDDEELISDVPPQIIGGRTMVPIRAVTEAVGCKVDWFSAERRIVIYAPAGGEPLLTMHIGDPTVMVSIESGYDGSITTDYVTIDSPPILIDGRTLVPLRFIAETIGFTVEWDGATQTVCLYSALYEPEGNSDISLTISNWPSAARYERIEESANSYTDMLDAVVFLTVKKLPRADADENSVKTAMSIGLGLDADSFPMKLEESLTVQYSYPTYITGYQTGENEDAFDNFALYMQTDVWDFLVVVSIPADNTDYYMDEVYSWFANLEIVHSNESGEIVLNEFYYEYSEDGEVILGSLFFHDDGAVDVDYPDETVYGCLYTIEGDKITIRHPDGTEVHTLTVIDTFRLVNEDGDIFYLNVF